MAISQVLLDTNIKIAYKTGIDAKGNDVIKTESIPDINLLASEANILRAVKAVGTLLAFPIVEIKLIETHLVSN